jgi:hypothetical protein
MRKDERHDKIRHNNRTLVEAGWSRHAVAFNLEEDFEHEDCHRLGNGEAWTRIQKLRRINPQKNKIEQSMLGSA